MSPLVAAIVVTVAALLVSGWWFGVHRRRKAETAAGISALAGMKWRECAGLVLQALGEKGYAEAPASRQPGDGGTEFLLMKGDERCLLGYKHGTAYRLGEANVRDFANAVQLQGATSGILVTLGSAEGFARDLARRYGMELIDGSSLWPQVEPFAPAALIEDIRNQAAQKNVRGQRMGQVASVVLGLLVFAIGTAMQPSDPPTPAVTGTPPASAPSADASASAGAVAAPPRKSLRPNSRTRPRASPMRRSKN
ncbi:restriction endonuclease [Arenimonas daejeonensis]|uniref:restriction endonuclease n=1 Tax=Arenimonas daejeonensis TaxID=370777 RepID=UPI0013155EEC|nr:restriction endonuclease [Arenimonas daejeonensis]